MNIIQNTCSSIWAAIRTNVPKAAFWCGRQVVVITSSLLSAAKAIGSVLYSSAAKVASCASCAFKTGCPIVKGAVVGTATLVTKNFFVLSIGAGIGATIALVANRIINARNQKASEDSATGTSQDASIVEDSGDTGNKIVSLNSSLPKTNSSEGTKTNSTDEHVVEHAAEGL